MHFIMRSSIAYAAVFAALILQSEVSASAQQVQWQVETPFAVPIAADRCMAVETFRKGTETLRLIVEARPASEQFAVLIEAPGSLGGKPWVEGTFLFGGKKPELDVVVVEAGARNGAIVYQLKINRAELIPSGDDLHLEIRTKPRKFDLSLNMPKIDSALSLLDDCASEFLEERGFAQESQRQIGSYPRPERNLYTYATSNDYPSAAVAAGAMGEAHVLVWVNVDRRASNCRLIRSSGHADIDAATCNILTRRVRYVPGRNLNGDPVAAPAYLTMRWELPR